MITSGRKVLAVIPLPYSETGRFWERDMGLLVSGLRDHGIDARLVAFGQPHTPDPKRPLILGSLGDIENPAWWKDQTPWGAVLNTWSAPRYDRIRQAALAATPRVLEKLDTDGVRAPWIWPGYYWRATLGGYWDSPVKTKRLFAPLLTLLRMGTTTILPALLDKKMARTMGQLPVVAAESPIATARMQRFLRRFGQKKTQVVTIPHPSAAAPAIPMNETKRGNTVISVGRWHTYQKNFPLLLSVLERFLTLRPGWNAEIVGELPKSKHSTESRVPETLRGRIRFHGLIPHHEISPVYQRSKIFLMTSRFESYNIAAAEALCCGCSVVGPSDIASVPFFVSSASGTSACRPSAPHLLDALCAEADAWKLDQRNPNTISQKWLAAVGIQAVSKLVIDTLEDIGP
ncbi:MAG TPA: glycosyltransferase [Verrucomicrobiae bacterium]|nr:glycosyltransferase [Verrucomicrobiae bacterium]